MKTKSTTYTAAALAIQRHAELVAALEAAYNALYACRVVAVAIDEENGNTHSARGRKVFPISNAIVRESENAIETVRAALAKAGAL